MTAKILNLRPIRKPRDQSTAAPRAYSDWLAIWLAERGLAEACKDVWRAWPPLEPASLKLARLLGRNLQNHEGQSLVGSSVRKAILGFQAKRGAGEPVDRAAIVYLSSLLECGEVLVTNRVEAGSPDGLSDLAVWDPTNGPFEEWCDGLPAHYVVTNHKIRADEGEYAAGRFMLAGQILPPSEFARLFYGLRETSEWNRL